jgi:glycosyltransferase involved in cell wall biosynthesis
MMAASLKSVGQSCYIVSLGRGSSPAKFNWFSPTAKLHKGVPLLYAPFTAIPLLSKIVSFFGIAAIVLRLVYNKESSVLFYNRTPAYAASLLICKIFGARCFLDLEDGELRRVGEMKRLLGFVSSINEKYFDNLCSSGALLACNWLASRTTIRPVEPYYGAVNDVKFSASRKVDSIRIFTSGSISSSTGSDTLIGCIMSMRQKPEPWMERVQFDITGMGAGIWPLQELASKNEYPKVVVHGRLSDSEYLRILKQCNVGLSLKPCMGALANSTFPSKVIEYATYGLLVIATDISDVRSIFKDNALYLTSDSPEQLMSHIRGLAGDLSRGMLIAEKGQEGLYAQFNSRVVGQKLRYFLVPKSNV